MMNTMIRSARPDDHAAAQRLLGVLMGQSFALDAALWEAVCQSENNRAFVAEGDDGSVIGLSVVVVSDRIRLAANSQRRRFYIDQLVVAPERRRQGIGRALLDHVIALARSEAPSYIIVNCDFTNVAARRVYESAGLSLIRQSGDRFEIAFAENERPS